MTIIVICRGVHVWLNNGITQLLGVRQLFPLLQGQTYTPYTYTLGTHLHTHWSGTHLNTTHLHTPGTHLNTTHLHTPGTHLHTTPFYTTYTLHLHSPLLTQHTPFTCTLPSCTCTIFAHTSLLHTPHTLTYIHNLYMPSTYTNAIYSLQSLTCTLFAHSHSAHSPLHISPHPLSPKHSPSAHSPLVHVQSLHTNPLLYTVYVHLRSQRNMVFTIYSSFYSIFLLYWQVSRDKETYQ